MKKEIKKKLLEELKNNLIEVSAKAVILEEHQIGTHCLAMAKALEIRESKEFKKFKKENKEMIELLQTFGFLGGIPR